VDYSRDARAACTQKESKTSAVRRRGALHGQYACDTITARRRFSGEALPPNVGRSMRVYLKPKN